MAWKEGKKRLRSHATSKKEEESTGVRKSRRKAVCLSVCLLSPLGAFSGVAPGRASNQSSVWRGICLSVCLCMCVCVCTVRCLRVMLLDSRSSIGSSRRFARSRKQRDGILFLATIKRMGKSNRQFAIEHNVTQLVIYPSRAAPIEARSASQCTPHHHEIRPSNRTGQRNPKNPERDRETERNERCRSRGSHRYVSLCPPPKEQKRPMQSYYIVERK